MTNDDGSKKQKRTRYGAPPPKGLEARKASGNVCTARRTNGQPCSNFAITGANVCRTHGGAAPQVRAKAQVRILMASDLAASKLIELMSNPKVDDRVKLAAAKDLLDRANLAGTQNVQIGVAQPKTFEDWVGEAMVDVDPEDDDPNVIDAEVIEDDAPLLPRDVDDAPVQNRFDRAAFAEVERSRERRVRPGGMTAAERKRAEDAALAGVQAAQSAGDEAERIRQHEAMLIAKANGTWNGSSRGEAMREAAARTQASGKRRARTSEATMTDGKGEGLRR